MGSVIQIDWLLKNMTDFNPTSKDQYVKRMKKTIDNVSRPDSKVRAPNQVRDVNEESIPYFLLLRSLQDFWNYDA